MLPDLGCDGNSDGPQSTAGEFNGSVIVVGAGAAGMLVGHLLAQRSINFRILEAAPGYGGRIKTAQNFVGFSIPPGGEWLHVSVEALPRIVNDDSVNVTTGLVSYDPTAPAGTYLDGRLLIESIGTY